MGNSMLESLVGLIRPFNDYDSVEIQQISVQIKTESFNP